VPAYPTLRCADAPAVLDWLERALGFVTHARFDDGDLVAHAEVACGDGLVMLGSARPDGADLNSEPGRVTVYVGIPEPDDVRARWERAQAAGATVARELATQDYGDGALEFSLRDPEGNVWSVGTYCPTP
jgi:uncharacterized glyoxalase superfamily protein PhnB